MRREPDHHFVKTKVGRVVPAVMLAAGLMGLSGCHRESEAGHGAGGAAATSLPRVAVQTQAATAGKHRVVEEVVGTVRPRVRSVIEAKVSGRILSMPIGPGGAVQAGDVLVEVDAQEIQARLAQARAVLEQAERELTRFGTLLRQEAVTRAEYDAVESRQRVAKAALAEAETMQGYTRVLAPFGGVVARKLADVGDLASPGRGLLELEDPASLRFEADVPLALAGRVAIGDRFPVSTGNGGTSVEAVVGEIEPTADPVSRTFRVKLDLPAGGGWRAGTFGRVSIPGEESTLLTVPAEALVVRGQMEYVFVVSDGKAHLRIVRSGKRVGGEVQILAGLEPGEMVVTRGGGKVGEGGGGAPGSLGDGQPVETR